MKLVSVPSLSIPIRIARTSLAVTVKNNNNNQHVPSILRNCCWNQDMDEEE